MAIDYMVCPFTPELLKNAGASATRVEQRTPIKFPEKFMAGLTVQQYLAFMDECGIEKSLVVSLKIGTAVAGPSRLTWDVSPEQVYKIVAQAPDRFRGVYGIDPLTRMDGVREMERAVKEYGFVGAHIRPYEFGPINNTMWYPFYTKCIELGIPVIAHIGHSAGMHPSAHGQPSLVDYIACDLPELKFVASHTRWPSLEDLIAVAWKHPNVYIGTAGHMPSVWNPSLIRVINTWGQDKVMWGTDTPFYDGKKMLQEIEGLGLMEGPKAKLLRTNALRVFKL